MRNELREIFGDRVSFDKVERMVYGHDVASLPAAVEKLVIKTPDAVVQPENAEELTRLVRFARSKKIPLVPRGAATSGYGGVIPIKGGIVVAFTRMNKIGIVDKENMRVTVQPGVIWSTLEDELKKNGLMLRLYPSSAPGATVGGWIGEGGSGIGSYEYGYISENVIEAKVVTPTGELKTFSGADLNIINRAEGTTGFIVETTLAVRELDEEKLMLTAFDDFRELIAAVKEVNKAKLPLWHVNFTTADFIQNKAEAVQLANEMDTLSHGGHGSNVHPPHGKHLLMIVYPGKRANEVETNLLAVLSAHNGDVLPKDVAEHEWAERFYTMRVKNLGPSLIPSEAIIPLDTIANVVEESQRKLEGISIEGSLVYRDDVTLLAFLTGDERTAAYNVGFAKSLVMMDIAKENGGRAYSVGLYFTDDAEEALGKENLSKIRDYKHTTDPDNIMNPGKILVETGNPSLLRNAMRMAKIAGEPLLDVAEKFLSSKPKVQKKLVDMITRASFACAQCGYCTDTCTLYMGTGWESYTPRGKWYILRQYLKGKIDLDQQTVDKFLMCTTCKRCNPVCQVNLPIMELWDTFRPILVNEMGFATYNAFQMMGASVESDLNIWAGRRSERDAWVPEDVTVKESADIAYWAGCTASLVTTDTAVNAVHILKEGGVEFCTLGQDEGCCGTPMLVAGKLDTFEFILRNNIEGLQKRGVKEVVISCPGCYMAFAHAYPVWAKKLGYDYDFKLTHISEMAERLIQEGKLNFKKPINKKLTWHDSCHIGRHSGIYDAPRNVIKALPGVTFEEMAHNREDALCCGSVLTRIGDPPVSDKLGAMRVQEAADIKADAMLATCPCCQVQLRVSADKEGIDVPILDFSAVVAEALGYEAMNSTDFTLYMWGVFEKALEIMTVDGIVDMMSNMMPEIMAAMPGAMQPMMKGMEALPGPVQAPALSAMEKMIPTLMPKLLPSMMPKLLPRVIELMEEAIPDMPDAMREKLPTLLPKVMDQIMPHMLPEVAPKLAPKMTEYMRSKKQKAAG
ncbi:MAG: FAD-binding protein [Bacillota bacterium]